MDSNFPNTVIYVAEHIGGGDPFVNGDTTGRATWYGITGYPVVQIDGEYHADGGFTCGSDYQRYLDLYNQRMAETGGVSPVEITGSFATPGLTGTMQAIFRLVDTADLGNIRATFIVYQDHIAWCCGTDGNASWSRIVRVIRSQPLRLVNAGDADTLEQAFDVVPEWNRDNLHVVALVQQIDHSKAIYQAARLLKLDSSVPEGPATAPTSFLSTRPNPFRIGVNLEFTVTPDAGGTSLTLVDVSGRLVRTLLDGSLVAGPHLIWWDGEDTGGQRVAPGVYFARLGTRSGARCERLVLVR